MKYQSTRGSVSNVSFEESLFVGYLQDGSLLMPESIPKLSNEVLTSWSTFSYQEICEEIFKLFAGKLLFSKEEFSDVYSTFPADIVPVKKLYDGEHILELFHGPTHSFKDLALAMAGFVLNRELESKGKHSLVYVCTSGDTGSAVAHVTKGKATIDSMIMFPGGDRITDFQRLLMTTIPEKNIHAFSGDCFCDDFDAFYLDFIKRLEKTHPDLVVTSLNSLLWLRIMMQTVHLIYGYFQVTKSLNEVTVVIPTGGCGHLTSAVTVQKLGIPLNIVPAFNSKNLNTYDFLRDGILRRHSEVTKSLSVAVDIQFACNIERLLYIWSDYNVTLVQSYMVDFYEKGFFQVAPELMEKIHDSVRPIVSSDEEILKTMRVCYEETKYIVDPHTALGVNMHFKGNHGATKKPILYLGCASPIKFCDVLDKAGIPVPESYTDYHRDLKALEEYDKKLPVNQKDWPQYCMDYVTQKVVQKHCQSQ